MEQDIDLSDLLLSAQLEMFSTEKPSDPGPSELRCGDQTVDENNNTVPSPATDDPTSPDSNQDNLETSMVNARRKVEYNLRKSSIVNRVETERRQKAPKEPKGKNRPAPLSKYRRRAANSRERGRMNEINDAFDDLAEVIPVYLDKQSKGKQTKITTLRLALNYIGALRETLGYAPDASLALFNSSGESCSSESSLSETASEGLQSPGRCNLDSEGEQSTR